MLLTDGSRKFKEGAESVGMYVTGFRAGRSRPPDSQELLQFDVLRDTPVWRIIMGDVPSDWEDPRRIPPQGGPPDDKDSYKEGHVRKVNLCAAGHRNKGSGAGGGGGVRPLPP